MSLTTEKIHALVDNIGGKKDRVIDGEVIKRTTAMADPFLHEVKRMHQLRQDINEMTPEEADDRPAPELPGACARREIFSTDAVPALAHLHRLVAFATDCSQKQESD